MNKDRLINEVLCDIEDAELIFSKLKRPILDIEEYVAEVLIEKGYRKTSEIAKEIFKDIDYMLLMMFEEYASLGHKEYSMIIEVVHHKVRALEKKYAEERG